MSTDQLRFQMPAEWAPHERTLMAWPVRESMCHPENYSQVCQGYAQIIQAISEFEPVTVIVCPGEEALVSSLLQPTTDMSRITLMPLPHNDAWLRDSGPTFVRQTGGELTGISWRFNAWGGKYSPWDLDDALASAILHQMGIPCLEVPLVMEGGSIHSDGEGTLLTTEECLLNPNRNPGLSRSAIEDTLAQTLGVRSFIWLKRGLAGDETDGHVDNIACFAAPGKVIMQVCHDPDDENAAITAENLAILHNARDAAGRPVEVVEIGQPPARCYEGKRLTLSYLNFYLVNGGLILPVFGGDASETDERAAATLAKLFPDRRIRRVDGMAIIAEGGNVHCTTQQMGVI